MFSRYTGWADVLDFDILGVFRRRKNYLFFKKISGGGDFCGYYSGVTSKFGHCYGLYLTSTAAIGEILSS